MSSKLYFDDSYGGPSAETSHPRFCKVAIEGFYYDCTDDFGPFGSDDGADTLAELEEWYRAGGQSAKIPQFLHDVLAGWDFGVPAGLLQSPAAEKEAWLAQDRMHDTYLQSECRARVATAFGQLKISGEMHPEIAKEADAAIACLLWLNARSRIANPDWAYADEERTKLLKMQAALGAAV